MEIFEMAKLLGLSIKESDEYKRAEAAKKAYEEDERIAALITEFDVQNKALTALREQGEADENLAAMIQGRLNEIYEQVLATGSYVAYESAKKDLDGLIKKVNTVIMTQVYGEVSACTHDCSTCGGCG